MKKQNGITLIALVISIIVMLILAGVSINAVVGDNGVIGKAQETLYIQSCAVLEEFLQMKYSENYGDTDEYRTAKDFLYSKYPNWFYRNSLGYISDAYGHALYLLNMEGIYQTNPELRNQIQGGKASSVGDFYGQKDVYGITSDLQVFYCSDGVDTILGVSIDDLDADNPLEEAYSKDDILSQMVNGEGTEEGLSYQDLKSITELIVDENAEIAVFSSFSELVNLKTVTLKNLSNVNLNGIGQAENLEIVNIENCVISDYSDIGNCHNIVSLYLINQTNEQAQLFMENLKSAELSKLEYLGMYGTTTNKITDISKLADWNSITKESIKYLYFHAEDISNIAVLSTFTNLEYLSIYNNPNLNSLVGIENLINLKTIFAYSCGLTSLPNFATNSMLEYLSIYSNANITTLNGLENCKKLQSLYAHNCAITDVTALADNISLTYLSLYTNADLVNVATIASCTSINNLYLANNTKMSVNDVKTLAPIIANCRKNYSIPSTYMQYLTTLTSYDYTNFNLTDASDQITHLKNGTQIYRLSLSGNKNLGKSRLASLIKSGQMNIEELEVVKENLTLTEEEIAYITTLQSYTLSQIQALTDTEIESLENESDIYLRYVLSTMTGLQYLSLKNISNLTDIDWVNKVTGLKGLDLYGVSATDLSLLETNGLELKDMRINNPYIELKDIQATISRCTGGSFGSTVPTSLGEGTGFEDMSYGCIIYGDALLNKLSTCTELTGWYYWCHAAYSSNDYTLDLTNCTNLKKLDVCRGIDGIIKLPASLEYTRLEDVGFYKVDFSQAASLKTLIMSACDYNAEGLDELATDLAYYDSIESITIGIYTKGNWEYIDWIDKFKNCSNLKELDISRYRHSWEGSYGDMSKLTMPSCLVTLNFGFMGITKLPDLSLCKNLENLYIDRNSIEDLDFATSLPALKNLIANDNKITSIAGIRNCKQLECINLENNFIYDNSYTTENDKTRAYNNCSIFAELYESNLRQLFLKGNYIDDFAPIINLGWEEENKSGF